MAEKKVFGLLSVSEANLRLSLMHLLSVVLDLDCLESQGCEDAKKLLSSGLRPEVLILYCPGEESPMLDLIRNSKSHKDAPVVMTIDCRINPDLEAQAFEAGADDVVRMPFTIKEFSYRLRARLSSKPSWKLDLLDGFHWDAEAFFAAYAGLTTAEAQVAHVLISKDGKIVTRDDLSKAIDNQPWVYGDRKFDVYVAKIRKKFAAAFGDRIRVSSIRSQGYRLVMNDIPAIEAEIQSL